MFAAGALLGGARLVGAGDSGPGSAEHRRRASQPASKTSSILTDHGLRSWRAKHLGATCRQQLWVDPRDEIVGVHFSVDLAQTPDFEPLWNADLFQNAISAAVDG
jgi:hypothetical protein